LRARTVAALNSRDQRIRRRAHLLIPLEKRKLDLPLIGGELSDQEGNPQRHLVLRVQQLLPRFGPARVHSRVSGIVVTYVRPRLWRQ
jgi:hypothetical protein